MVFLNGCIITAVLCTVLFAATPVSIKGRVTDGTAGIEGASVSLVKQPSITGKTDPQGNFLLIGEITGVANTPGISISHSPRFGIKGTVLNVVFYREVRRGTITLINGSGQKVATVAMLHTAAGKHQVALPRLHPGFYIMSVVADDFSATMKLVNTGDGMHLSGSDRYRLPDGASGHAKEKVVSAVELLVEKSGFVAQTVAIDSYTADNLLVTLEKESSSTGGNEVSCVEKTFPASAPSGYTANAKLPDPFKTKDGSRMSKKSQWCEQRAYLSALLQATSLGVKPPKPEEVTATFSGGTLSITCKEKGKSISFSVSISNVPTGEGPHPAIITLGKKGSMMAGAAMAIPAGVAEIQYDHDGMAAQGGPSHGSGLFYTLYGKDHSAGAMMAWAWGVSRIIDALELPDIASKTKINPARLGITGCSRNGKGAMVCGAFDERMALTLPMEGGSGGISAWRIANVENGNKTAHPDGCQTASQIIGENCWMSTSFDQFAKGGSLDKLPTDAHTLAAVCAPRGIFMVEGSQNSWNCNVCCFTAASAARMVYSSLGAASNIGIVMTDHGHCSISGSKEKEAWNAFIKKFLLGDAATATDYFSKDGSFDKLIDFTKWIDWETPTLE